MIKKSRLEELIKQGATIYCADRDAQFPIPIFLNEEDFVKKEDLPHEENCIRDNILLEDLYETEEQAEWALKYQFITRTEELNLPIWEEFCKHKYISFNDEFCSRYVLKLNKNSKLILTKYPEDWEIFYEQATEENYEKACDLCVKLFKGDIGE